MISIPVACLVCLWNLYVGVLILVSILSDAQTTNMEDGGYSLSLLEGGKIFFGYVTVQFFFF